MKSIKAEAKRVTTWALNCNGVFGLRRHAEVDDAGDDDEVQVEMEIINLDKKLTVRRALSTHRAHTLTTTQCTHKHADCRPRP